MQIHIVAGFLGSGKTTAIISAARGLVSQGKTVGVITNDQGKFLVDSAFVRAAGLPNVEVTGGCFCCNYPDLDRRLDQLILAANPDVIFAESVGSCADLVATVIKPMLSLRSAGQGPTSFSVFTDSRLLRRSLFDEPLPFSDEVNYIFAKQIEEARLVIVNKIDLLSAEAQAGLLAGFRNKFPNKIALPQNSLTPGGVQTWLNDLESGEAPLPADSLEIDYARYGQGEAQLSWVDELFTLSSPEPAAGRQAVLAAIHSVLVALKTKQIPIGHIKFFFDDGTTSFKTSLTSLEQTGWQAEIPAFTGKDIRLLVNARAETASSNLRAVIEEAIRESDGWKRTGSVDAFHPGQPRPTYRM